MIEDSQCQLLLKEFITGGSVTGVEALRKFGIMSLPRRIKNLKDGKHDGLFWPIEDKWEYKYRPNGKIKKRWKRWFFQQGWEDVMQKPKSELLKKALKQSELSLEELSVSQRTNVIKWLNQ